MNEESATTYPALQSAMGADEEHNSRTSTQSQSMSSPSSLFLMENIKSPCPSPGGESVINRGAENKRNTAVADKKPPGLSYIALISMAIQSSDSQKRLLSEIYQWIADRYPYYQMKDKSWRNSIRHNLSLNECFVKSGRSENGKGNYWSIHPANIDDFAKGDFRRRRARRRVRICDKDLQMLCSNDGLTKSPPPVQKTNLYEGYIPMASTTVPASFMTSFGPEPMKCQPDWYQPEYYPCKSYDYKPFQPIMPSRDTVCHYQGNPGQLNTDFLPYGNNMPYSAPNTPGSSAQVDSKFNVNVSVNVCGSGSSSQRTSPQLPLQTTPQHEQQQQQQQHQVLHQDHEAHHQHQHHPLFMPHHFQSAYTSQYSHMYGTTYQELLAPSVL